VSDFAKVHLPALDDLAAGRPFGEVQEARFAGAALGAEATGLALQRVKPGRRQAFGHRHDAAEEVYVVVAGSGRAKVGEELVELGPLDALRVAPAVPRAFEAGPDGLDLLALGPRHEGDGEILTDFWPEGA
jgi:uncharacterized cupin superfamily protein